MGAFLYLLGFTGITGLDSYIPILCLAFAAALNPNKQYINPNVNFLTQGGWLTFLVIMVLADFIIDKVPGLDLAWNSIHIPIRLIIGGLIAAATVQGSGFWYVVAVIFGAVVSLVVHLTKTGIRFSGGSVVSPALSIGEDIVVVIILLIIFGTYPS